MDKLPIDLKILPYLIYLSSKDILNENLENKLFISNKRLEDLIFLNQRKHNFSLPNYIHTNHTLFLNQKGIELSLENSFREIAEYYLDNNENTVNIQKDKFEEWQHLISIINPIPIITFFVLKKNINLKNFFKYSSLPSMNFESNDVKSFFSKKRAFSELHIHLNGTSEVIFNWQHFLNNPSIIYKNLKYNLHFEQLAFKNIKDMMNLIEMARNIQENIVYIIKNKDFIDTFKIENYLEDKKIYKKSNHKHPVQLLLEDTEEYSIPCYEYIFFQKIFETLDNKTNCVELKKSIEKLTHLYLLIYSQFNKLLVQQYEQYGFDQFQMITDNGIRDFYEDIGYKDRFNQLKGVDCIKFDTVEGRFAPKKDSFKTYKLLNKAIQDYRNTNEKNKVKPLKYLKKLTIDNHKNQINQLSLTAHFIKKKTTNCILNSKSPYIKLIKCPRHSNLRKELYNQSSILINLIKTHKGSYITDLHNIIGHSYFKYINGIDAAGNELNANPEVFAPSFIYMRDELKKINKTIGFSFHAGEDFIHIISGIRYIYEAVEFLDMKKKDRIGHATALGIDPILWQNKLNNQVLIKKGEWLDNLIFLCKILNLNELGFIKIGQYWKEIYGFNYPNVEIAFKAYLLRKYDPDRFFSKKTSYIHYDTLMFDKEVKEIYEAYHYDSNVKKNYEELIPITISKYLHYIVPLQKVMLKKLHDKDIAIEVMPTSNTRISFYDQYEDHHIFKWLDKKEIPSLVIATDDPGIFNTNLKNEYSHLYKVLSEKYDKSDEYILNTFNTLNNNSKKYAF